MGGVEGFTADAVEKIAGQRFFGGEGDGVNQAVEAVPRLAQIGEHAGDFFIVLHVAAEHQLGAEAFGQLAYAVFEFVHHIGKRQLGALLVAGFGDAVGDGAVGNHAGDEDFLAL